jgi:hypothetical protein
MTISGVLQNKYAKILLHPYEMQKESGETALKNVNFSVCL